MSTPHCVVLLHAKQPQELQWKVKVPVPWGVELMSCQLVVVDSTPKVPMSVS